MLTIKNVNINVFQLFKKTKLMLNLYIHVEDKEKEIKKKTVKNMLFKI